jgi:hypothetical protein
MDLGTRSIRSSGAGSGSVEITLPAALRPLLGVSCRISLRDGHRPEIVLTPDFRPAMAAFAELWARLVAAFGLEHGLAALPIGEFAVSLDPAERDGAAALALVDGLALAGPTPHDRAALARVTAGLATHLAVRLEIDATLAAEFAAAAGFVVTGIALNAASREICDITGALLRPSGAEPGAAFARNGEDATSPALWRALGAPLQSVAATFAAWSHNPIERHSLSAAWRRGLSLELKEH